MSNLFRSAAIVAAVVGGMSSVVLAAPPVAAYTESFDADNASWLDNANLAAGYASDLTGGHLFNRFNFANQAAGGTPVLFRANSSPLASGGKFFGDWVAGGVTEFSFDIRHNYDGDLTFYTRIAQTPFPGATILSTTNVAKDTWTTVTFSIDPSNPLFLSFEGSDFNTVFSAISRVQIGVSTPAALGNSNTTVTFELDNVRVVPAPASAMLLGLLPLAGRRRRN